MDWKHFLYAVLAAGVASSFSDWFFFGVLFHGKYVAHPEVWRQGAGVSETPAVIASTLIGFLTSAAFMAAYAVFGMHGYPSAFKLAILVWLMAPLPITVTNALFIKLHPLVVVSHSLGWLARLALAAVAAGWLLG
ncbi:MAG TPA: hypothetical protein VKR82_06555 [Candidatus Acidoferrales bacterium]|nr:hypothetical protein [Candidatus Acidoferrales bacterium]